MQVIFLIFSQIINFSNIQFFYIFLNIRAINSIKPGSIGNIYEGALPFKQMENINNYLTACRSFGMPDSVLFQTGIFIII